MGSSRPPSLEMDPNFSLEVADKHREEIARYSQELGESPQEAFDRKIQTVIRWSQELEGRSFIAFFVKKLPRSAVEVTGGDYRLEIPHGFLLKHGDLITSPLTFMMSNARSWEIRLCEFIRLERRRVLAMGTGGWRTFVDDNGFQEGDVLFFQLKSQSRFRVIAARRPE